MICLSKENDLKSQSIVFHVSFENIELLSVIPGSAGKSIDCHGLLLFFHVYTLFSNLSGAIDLYGGLEGQDSIL